MTKKSALIIKVDRTVLGQQTQGRAGRWLLQHRQRGATQVQAACASGVPISAASVGKNRDRTWRRSRAARPPAIRSPLWTSLQANRRVGGQACGKGRGEDAAAADISRVNNAHGRSSFPCRCLGDTRDGGLPMPFSDRKQECGRRGKSEG